MQHLHPLQTRRLRQRNQKYLIKTMLSLSVTGCTTNQQSTYSNLLLVHQATSLLLLSKWYVSGLLYKIKIHWKP